MMPNLAVRGKTPYMFALRAFIPNSFITICKSFHASPFLLQIAFQKRCMVGLPQLQIHFSIFANSCQAPFPRFSP